MKSFTDLEQSKKLAKILPITTIDFAWNIFSDGSTRLLRMDDWEVFENATSNVEIIPCWSLAALIDIINTNYYTTLYHDGVAWNIDMIHHDNVKEKHSVYANTPIDACIEIIEKLYEQKKFVLCG